MLVSLELATKSMTHVLFTWKTNNNLWLTFCSHEKWIIIYDPYFYWTGYQIWIMDGATASLNAFNFFVGKSGRESKSEL